VLLTYGNAMAYSISSEDKRKTGMDSGIFSMVDKRVGFCIN
jgi:hypothetical protein